MPNPWMSLWLSAANSWANAVRSFWTAELHRQQMSMANAMVSQTMNFWARTWMMPFSGPYPKRDPKPAAHQQQRDPPLRARQPRANRRSLQSAGRRSPKSRSRRPSPASAGR
jgi:hypothetical protein